MKFYLGFYLLNYSVDKILLFRILGKIGKDNRLDFR